jgi:HEAT repeat protein
MTLRIHTPFARLAATLAAVGILVALSTSAIAQSQADANADADRAEAPSLERYRSALETGDEEQVLKALEAIRKAKDPAAAGLVNALLERGGTVKVTVAAIETAGTLGQESSSVPILPYVRHRGANVRRAAVGALSETGGKAAVRSLRAALRSRDSILRGLAATGLGKIGNSSVVPDLLRALDHNVTEAAPSIAKLCTPVTCAQLIPRLATLPFPVTMSALDDMMLRPNVQVPDAIKLLAIQQISSLRTKQAHKYLKHLQQRWPADFSPGVKAALDAAVKATAGAKK